MRIVIQNPLTKAETVLCDGYSREADRSVGPNGLTIGTQRVVEVAQYLRGTDVTVYDRGNQQTQLAFGVSRRCATVGAALSWETLHHVTCLRAGTLFITVDEGAVRQVRLLAAAITGLETSLVGVSVRIAYTIVGGVLLP